MLSKPHVLAALRAQGASLLALERRTGEQLAAYTGALEGLADFDAGALCARLAGVARPGALPSLERVAGRSLVRAFGRHWANHAEARAWAAEVLQGVTVVAVDGSQITPNPDYSLPVGAAQVGWFINPHRADQGYVKDIRFEVLGPADLELEGADSDAYPDLQVNARRFELECEALVEQMRRLAGAEPLPVCLFDGSLIISFAAQMRPGLQQRYLRAVQGMLAASEETRVPLVGYVDHSRARDLAWMLHWLAPAGDEPTVTDGAILSGLLTGWGDRSEALVCARDDRLFRRAAPEDDYYGRVLFVYLKTTLSHPPARLDVPAWVLEAGQLEHVLDVVRAECVVGTGYPYAVETADALAVITGADRERFYRLFQEYVESLHLTLRYARKAYSKRQRR